jgi:hypothetical protein
MPLIGSTTIPFICPPYVFLQTGCPSFIKLCQLKLCIFITALGGFLEVIYRLN